ncbi:MAG TPA: hypothetical protein VFN10_24280 [Thermoanaerobaculia bacterium]|nr:hypothetical protein [Thermoanaerobaculia bacterium]
MQQFGFTRDQAGEEIAFSLGTGQLSLDPLRATMKSATPAMRAAIVEQALVWIKAYMATPQFAQKYSAFRENYKPGEPGWEDLSADELKEMKKQYAADLAQWNQDYPANSKVLLAQRLREFLEVSANVDYNAKLVRSGSKMRFANENYESESGEWKLCYRAGKAPVEKARAFAKAWLAELK